MMASLRAIAAAPIRLPLAVTGATLGLMRKPVAAATRALDPDIGELVGELTDNLGRELTALLDPRRLRTQRRTTVHDNRIHAEVRGLREHGARVSEALHRHFEDVPGVHWLRVNAATGRVTIAADPDLLTPARVERMLERVEELAGTGDLAWSRGVEHPSDAEPVLTSALQLAGDVIGLGTALAGRALPGPPPADTFRAAVSLIDGQPRLRRLVEDRLGRHRTDTVLTAGNALSQAMDAQITGLLGDAVQRAVRLVEAGVRYAQWRRWDDLIAEPEQPSVSEFHPPGPRPVPLPRGPIERCTDEIGTASALASAAALTGGRGLPDAADAVSAGVPKAARAGRETYAGTLATIMAARGVLTLDPTLWRRLDRVS
ncbi:hypothetical protein ACW9HQ_36815, partial [Nocardia gipuzkoensis]